MASRGGLSLAFFGAFPWPLLWGGGPVRLALSRPSRGPFRAFLAVPWLLAGSCGGCWLGGGFLVGLGWPPLAFPLGFVGSGWSGPSGPLRAFLRPFPGLSCVFSGAGCWCPCGESYLGPPWVPVGVPVGVWASPCWDPGRKWSKGKKRLSPPAAGMVFVEGVRGVSKMVWGREVFHLLIFYLFIKVDKYSLLSSPVPVRPKSLSVQR